ncbi:MAG: hypothetical protein UY48_C0046G0004 [Candidatus Gottesmanbacteria bacterium GW2011_GWB1_49_7]|uniref:DUF1353 domain-containing protein n=1 Tax=Candidatus Gottesmanbacteria bacterium GW2011_GWB1_49_7 TaxID=1618448 RepID=A0A0G1VV68_9BACT|nr:MAG: hypothetical protein UY48_C0046G0004 [Candidatus Gottesmanbacteria bacterium GW2011_GWB1_49_7]
MAKLKYTDGWKYRTEETIEVQIDFHPQQNIVTSYGSFDITGKVIIFKGYSFDGPSGPCKWLSELPLGVGWLYRRFALMQIFLGALVHDFLYQLIREEYLNGRMWRQLADHIFRVIIRRNGTSGIRAWWIYTGVRIGGGPSADKRGTKPILTAPAQ